MNKGILSLIGFSLFILGMLSLVLSLVSVQLSFLSFLESFGKGLGLLIKLAMIVLGAVLVVVTRGDFEGKGRV
ncbi:MAG: hypothetical protein ACI8YQ_000449 [Polaribacter sp.]|jgi:hypothetical protein